MKIDISTRSLRAMKRHAGRDYPHECCGFLVGRKARGGRRIAVEEDLPAENLNRERAHDRYEISPLAYLRLEESLQGTRRGILGYYHSHPDHPSRPSETDLTMFGGWPGYIYVIVGVDGKTAKSKRYTVTAWSLEEHELVSV